MGIHSDLTYPVAYDNPISDKKAGRLRPGA